MSTEWGLTNYMEKAAQRTLEEILETRPEYADFKNDAKACGDVLAYALNRLPPKYVFTRRGDLFTRAEELRQQFHADLWVVLTQALEKVQKNKRCGA